MSAEKQHEGRGSRPPRGAARRAGTKRPARAGRYPVELRRQAVKLHVEESIPLELVAQEFRISPATLGTWFDRYQQEGDAGLVPRSTVPGKRKAKLPPAVHEAIVEVKREHPRFGVRRISQWLRRTLFLTGSPETVRQTLHRQGLMPKAQAEEAAEEPTEAALLRAQHAQPALAERHLHLSAGRQERLPDRVRRRLLPLHGRSGRVTGARRRRTCWRCTAGRRRSTGCRRRC